MHWKADKWKNWKTFCWKDVRICGERLWKNFRYILKQYNKEWRQRNKVVIFLIDDLKDDRFVFLVGKFRPHAPWSRGNSKKSREIPLPWLAWSVRKKSWIQNQNKVWYNIPRKWIFKSQLFGGQKLTFEKWKILLLIIEEKSWQVFNKKQ